MAYKYCVIKSKLSGHALDISGGSAKAGAEVVLWERHGRDNQIWFEDPSTGTIRSKLNPDLCLDIEGGSLRLSPYKPNDNSQQWERHDNQIRNKKEQDTVFDVLNQNRDKGAKVGSWKYNGGDNQSWDFEYVGGEAPNRSRHFYIVSELNDKVVDISGGSASAGAKITMWKRNPGSCKNQLWYCDSRGFVRSVLNDMVFTSSDKGKDLKTQGFSEDSRSKWRLDGKRIVNDKGECLDISGAKKDDGADLCSYDYNGKSNQHWRIDYV